VREPGAELLDELVAFLRRFLVFAKSSQAHALALWIVHTHALDAADATPYMNITSAVRESGKSRVGDVVFHLVARPLPTANISTAALFRAIDKMRPTLLFDEIDATFNSSNFDEEKRGILNAGYTRGQRVYRMGGAKNNELQSFEVFGAKMLIGLAGLPDTLASRSIAIAMKRKKRGEKVSRLRQREIVTQSQPLRDQIARWAVDHLESLAEARPEDILEISDRAFDVWEPLLAIADEAGADWPVRARAAARALSAASAAEDDTLTVQLLADVRTVFGDREHVGSSELAAALRDLTESPWGEIGKNGLTTHQLARRLRPFGVRPRHRWIDGADRRGYWLDELRDSFERYLTDSERQSVGNGSTMPLFVAPVSVGEELPRQSENGEVLLNQADSVALTVQQEGDGRKTDERLVTLLRDTDPGRLSERGAA
jgi:hypothetical protein